VHAGGEQDNLLSGERFADLGFLFRESQNRRYIAQPGDVFLPECGRTSVPN
jgi:hypothetical protein